MNSSWLVVIHISKVKDSGMQEYSMKKEHKNSAIDTYQGLYFFYFHIAYLVFHKVHPIKNRHAFRSFIKFLTEKAAFGACLLQAASRRNNSGDSRRNGVTWALFYNKCCGWGGRFWQSREQIRSCFRCRRNTTGPGDRTDHFRIFYCPFSIYEKCQG